MLILIGHTADPGARRLHPVAVRVRPQAERVRIRGGSEHADLIMRWDAAGAGLAGAELEHALGNLSTQDYQAVNRQLLSEAASIMAEMELSEDEEERMLSALREEVSSARARVEGA